jgi:phosphoribosylaminoimidazolecarboxamide formyltransferase/IMP cyclohydrolase
VFDKTGLVELGRGLHDLGIGLFASGGTASTLRNANLQVTDVSQLSGFPEILDGRVKTLHPAVFGGILARRTAEHLAQLQEEGLVPIDLVVCNLYPFQETVARSGVTVAEAVEQIDIGGVALLRAAGKNFESVIVVCDPEDYSWVVEGLRSGGLNVAQRRQLALKAFRHTAAYDAAIAAYLERVILPDQAIPPAINLTYQRAQTLRYGENPHQQAALLLPADHGLPFEQLAGKEMSYNNWLDTDAAWALAQEFADPTVCIVKHTNPCGVASATTLAEAYPRALQSDPISAFGSIIALNRPADLALAQAMADLFVEVVVAPGFDEAALAVFRRKPNLRVLQGVESQPDSLYLRSILGALLAQTGDTQLEPVEAWQVMTERHASHEELIDLDLAWRVAKHVKSNAIVLAKGGATVGVGAGQMSRVDSVHLAALRAGDRAHGAVLASDAFFPFPDGIEAAADAGVTAIVQPGGSRGDEAVIAACDRLGIAMCFTGVRHFRH